MDVRVTNAQRRDPVQTEHITRLARCALKCLHIRRAGTFAISFIDSRTMRTLNKRVMGHDYTTDVLSFRYDGEPIVGEILIAPSQARAYAAKHGLAYHEELCRYVAHGLLHWLGHEDATRAQQRRMRALEDRLLARCPQRKSRLSDTPT